MSKVSKIKEELYNRIKELMIQKVDEAMNSITSIKESRDNDTKSSAGDKHETSRALAQIEMDKLEVQLSKTLQLQKEFSTIRLQKEYTSVEFGSLVYTNHENYFISIGMGKIEVEGEIYYAVSLASPIGHGLKGKKAGDKVLFQGREISIDTIV